MRTPRTRFSPVYSRPLMGGVQHIYQIGGHQVSVISHQYSYGGKSGLWEVRVDSQEPQGWLTDEGLADHLTELEKMA